MWLAIENTQTIKILHIYNLDFVNALFISILINENRIFKIHYIFRLLFSLSQLPLDNPHFPTQI